MKCRKLGLLFLTIYVLSVFGMFIIFVALDHQNVLSGSRNLPWGLLLQTPPRQAQCAESSTSRRSPMKYTRLDNRIQVISTFYDTRLKQSNFVRSILVVLGKFGLPKLFCTVTVVNETDSNYAETNFTSRGSLYEFNENHERRFGGHILSCPVPKSLVLVNCQMHIMTVSRRSHNRTAVVPLTIIPGEGTHPRYKISVCVPPLWGHIKPAQIVEFVEILKLMGVEHFQFYVMQNSRYIYFPNEELVRPYLQYYKETGHATITPWTLPSKNPMEIWYYGQVLAIHDCLYRHMGKSEFVAFNDIDEIIVPKVSKDWISLLDYLENSTNSSHCGYRVQMSFFPPMPIQGPVIMNSVFRSSKTTDIRTKCVVRPERIFEMGIHHISKQLVEKWAPGQVEERVALIHHYRQCDSMFGMKCGVLMEDNTLLQHQKQFTQNYNHVLEYVQNDKLHRTNNYTKMRSKTQSDIIMPIEI